MVVWLKIKQAKLWKILNVLLLSLFIFNSLKGTTVLNIATHSYCKILFINFHLINASETISILVGLPGFASTTNCCVFLTEKFKSTQKWKSIMSPYIPIISFNHYQHFFILVSSLSSAILFFYFILLFLLKYVKANAKIISISLIHTSDPSTNLISIHSPLQYLQQADCCACMRLRMQIDKAWSFEARSLQSHSWAHIKN